MTHLPAFMGVCLLIYSFHHFCFSKLSNSIVTSLLSSPNIFCPPSLRQSASILHVLNAKWSSSVLSFFFSNVFAKSASSSSPPHPGHSEPPPKLYLHLHHHQHLELAGGPVLISFHCRDFILL